MKVCILAAGLGSRLGEISEHYHKSLLPLGNMAVISRIIEKFPTNSEFVIAIGNKGEQVRSFIKVAHPDLKIEFVKIDPFEGPNSGPGLSLYQCKQYLNEPFFFIACDTIINDPIPNSDDNWIGVAKVDDPQNWCTALIDNNNLVVDLEYKYLDSDAEFAFSGIAYVKNYDDFWKGMALEKDDNKEIQVNDGILALIKHKLFYKELSWSDTGQLESYNELLKVYDKNLSFAGKLTELTYFYDNTVVKLYPTVNKAENWYRRASSFKGFIPELITINGAALSYKFVKGYMLSKTINGAQCTNFLEWMKDNFWVDEDVDEGKFNTAQKEFYYTKTIARINNFEKKHSSENNLWNDDIYINDLNCMPVRNQIELISNKLISGAIPSRFHGDLHGDNIIVSDDNYYLIDWRDGFAGLAIGDRYYDFAKFLHTLELSVATMESEKYEVKNSGNKFQISNKCEARELEAQEAFWSFILENEYDADRVEMLNALTFLNMAPLYDKKMGIYLYLLGQYKLQVVINKFDSVASV